MVSPDGSRIGFLKQQKQEIWTMGQDGERPTRVYAAPPGQSLSQLAWSPDGRWLTYVRRVGETGSAVLEARFPGAVSGTKIFESANLRGFCWLSSRYMVLNLWEAPDQPTSNLWQIEVDSKMMKPVDKLRRLTNWAGFAVGAMSASKDGRRLVVEKRFDQSHVVIGDLADNGEKLRNLRRFTSEERIHWPGGWSPDSKWLLLQSDRTGRMSIFRQRLDSASPELVVANKEDNWSPILSPDGQWILYMVPQQAASRLMRTPVTRGSGGLILEAKGLPAFVRLSRAPLLVTSHHVSWGGTPAFRCPGQPGAQCVLSEAVGREVVFSSFDPLPAAQKTEIFRVAVDDPNDVFWDLSGDGRRIVYGITQGTHPFIHVRELMQETTRDVFIPGWPELVSVSWSADGKSIFATEHAPKGGSLMHITLDGKVAVLYKAPEPTEVVKASPDGRYMAFGQVVSDSNVWLIEGILQ